MTRAPHLDPLDAPADLTPTTAVEAHVSGTPAAAKAETEETFVVPASLEQSRYWTLDQIDPGSTASNMAISCELAGPLDPLVLEQAIAGLTLRHEALRTLFRMEDGVLSQIILTRPMYEFTQADLSGAEHAEAALAAALSAHSHAPIDLERGPVLRARLLRLAAERHVLALTMNHIVCDGWSNGLLMRDLVRIYDALRRGAGPIEEIAAGVADTLPELPFQFADFTLWQNEYLASPRAEDDLAFWTSHIPRDLPALDMPADHPRRAGRSFPGTIASTLLPPSLNEALIAYCRKIGSTKHIALLAVFEALCARYSGQQRFLLGSTIANRTQPGMEDVVGRFANPQMVVADVHGDPSFRQLEQRVREWESSAYSHQDLPFSRIIEAFQISQEGAGSQFLSVWFVYQKAFMQPQEAADLRLTPLRSVSGGVDFDLLVSVVERAEGPRLQIEYNTELFTGERIAGLLDAFENLLTRALAEPDRPLSALSFAEDIATSQPAADAIGLGHATELWDMVASHAQAQPRTIAVAAGERQLSWQDLVERSRALAAHLERESSLAGASRALLVLTPELEPTIALLALAALGENAPRVTPLAAQITAQELHELLRTEDGGRALVFAPERLTRHLPAAGVVAYEGLVTLPAAPSFAARPMPAFWSALNTATAETGNASAEKRFATEDVSFPVSLRAAAALARELGLTAKDCLLAVSPASPADGLFDLLLALTSGAQLDLVGAHADIALQPLLNERQPSVAIAEPAHWRAWANQGWSGDRRLVAVARGRHIAHGSGLPVGEAKTRETLLVLSAKTGPVASARDAGDFVPLPGVRLTITGAQGEELPPGAIGVLADALGSTGYLAQAAGNGAFRVRGEAGSLVHLHGHRMRLSDLDAALLGLPGVYDAATVIVGEAEVPQLTAWVSGDASLDGEQIRRALEAAVPHHLIPDRLDIASTFAFAPDGAVDITRLSAAPQASSAVAALPVAATVELVTDDVTRELSDIWRDVLNLQTVDPHRSFFSAGGNSLLLVRLFARINKAFGTRLPITTIFDAETIAKLSTRLRQQGEIRSMVPVQPHGHRPPVFMIHSYLLYQGLSQALGSNQPFYGLRELETDSELSMQERVANYVREIRAVQPHGPYSVMGWCAAGPLTVEVARQLTEAGETMASVILFDSWLPGYLSSVEGVRANGSIGPKWQGLRSKLRRHGEKMQALSLPQRVQYLRGAASRYVLHQRDRFFIRHWSGINTLANRFRMPLPQFMYNTTLNTFAALSAYRPQPVPIRITLIRAHDTREVPGASAACGWEQVAMQGVDVLWAPGDHESMFLGEKLEATSELVRRCLQHSELAGIAALPAPHGASSRVDHRLLHAGSL